MPENTICHGIDGKLYEKLERLAKAAGMTPDEYATKLGAERIFEKTRPKGAGKIRHLPTTRRDPPQDLIGPEKGGADEGSQ
ncbi:hypothetical protein K3169_13905 [Pseudomonas phytophila]|uniref:Uncharacterized protein n=1 Tax=Pseudomonas phytophila TaxID=2867264 RepID=A0ABY6FLU1_9PSED|nr:hypothetical protein [Pseudomonas phytophila]UXZ98878.1 hypothetical protein K3169_13905 [Pseudomonas phytophila]